MRFRFFSERGSIQSALAIPLIVAGLGAIGYTFKLYDPVDGAANAGIAAVQNSNLHIATTSASGIYHYIDQTGRGEERAANIAKAMFASFRGTSAEKTHAACVYGVDVDRKDGELVSTTRFAVSSNPDYSCPEASEDAINTGEQLYESSVIQRTNLPLAVLSIVRIADSEFIKSVTLFASTHPTYSEIMRAAARGSGSGFPGTGVGGGPGFPLPGGLPGGGDGDVTPDGDVPMDCIVGVDCDGDIRPDDGDIPPVCVVGVDCDGDIRPDDGDILPRNPADMFVSSIIDDWLPAPKGSGMFAYPTDPKIVYNSLNQTFSIPDSSGQTTKYKIDLVTGSVINLSAVTHPIPLSALMGLLNSGSDIPDSLGPDSPPAMGPIKVPSPATVILD